MFDTEEEFRQRILELRKMRRLHLVIQQKIHEIFHEQYPDSFVINETAKISRGHRVDTIVCLADGRKVHFEFFAHANTVSRDINSLVNSNADIQIAVILDDIDKRVSDTYFHELASRGLPASVYPIFQFSEILVSAKKEKTINRLKGLLQGKVAQHQILLNELRQPAREWYVIRKEIESEALVVLRKKTSTKNLFVTGPRGIGKSSLLAHIHSLASKHTTSIIKRTVINETWVELLIQLDKEIQHVLEQLGGNPVKHKLVSHEERLIETLRELSSRFDQTIVLIIDQFERLFERGEMSATNVETEKVWRSFSSIVQQTNTFQKVRWVIAAREQYYFVLFPRFGSLEECEFSYVAVPPFSSDESEELLKAISTQTGFELTSKAEKMLLENTGNHPQNIILSFINLCEGRSPSAKIDETVLEKEQPWREVFEKDFSKLATQTEKLVIYAMAHTQKEVCTIEEIMNRVKLATEISEKEMRDVLRHIQNVLSLIRQPKADVFEFYHARFADFVKEKYGREFPEEWDVHRLIDAALTLVNEKEYYRSREILKKVVRMSSDCAWIYEKAEDMALKNEDLQSAMELVVDSFKLFGDRDGKKSEKVLRLAEMMSRKAKSPGEQAYWLLKLASFRIGSPYKMLDYFDDPSCIDLFRKSISLEKARHYLKEGLSRLRKIDLRKSPPYYLEKAAGFLYELEELNLPLKIYLSIFEGDQSYFRYNCVDKAKRILLRQHREKEVVALCEQAASKIKGWSKKAEWLQIAAELLWKTDRQKSLRLLGEASSFLVRAAQVTHSPRAIVKYYTDMVKIRGILTSKAEAINLFTELRKSIEDIEYKELFTKRCQVILKI